MFRIAICDDEKNFCEIEKKIVSEYMMKNNHPCDFTIFQSGTELLDFGEKIAEFDIIFLDVVMEQMDGMETAKQIRKITEDAYLVFVTAVIKHSLEGYKVDAIRYLLKDDRGFDKAIFECLDAIFYKMDKKAEKCKIEFKSGKVVYDTDDILYIESRLHNIFIHPIKEEEDTTSMRGRLNDVEESLRGKGFCRIHQSFLVNLKYVKGITGDKAILENGEELTISRSKYKKAKNEWIFYQGEV